MDSKRHCVKCGELTHWKMTCQQCAPKNKRLLSFNEFSRWCRCQRAAVNMNEKMLCAHPRGSYCRITKCPIWENLPKVVFENKRDKK